MLRRIGTSWRRRATMLAAWTAVLVAGLAYAAPPNYAPFKRDQIIDYAPDETALLRIWVIYIGQGDAVLIQFPKKFASPAGDPVEMLVDGGPKGFQLVTFLDALYPVSTATIEHAVLTHHDADHVEGLITLLDDGRFPIANLYHNGLVSWRAGSRGIPGSVLPTAKEGVAKGDRGMALYQERPHFQDSALVKDRAQLLAGVKGYEGVYKKFAAAVEKGKVALFPRTHLDDTAFPASVGDIKLTPLWPSVVARGYGEKPGASPDWSHSINGNSVAFRLEYGEFSMLFTGDLNADSETELLTALEKTKRLDTLHTDVLKIPHHGSKDGSERFFKLVNPVLSVASMGRPGFFGTYKHPSPQVVGWLGGANRVYHTFIHERVVTYPVSAQARLEMPESKHVLIETDGRRFRIVEVDDPTPPYPKVPAVKRGDGTRWIDAAEKPGS